MTAVYSAGQITNISDKYKLLCHNVSQQQQAVCWLAAGDWSLWLAVMEAAGC